MIRVEIQIDLLFFTNHSFDIHRHFHFLTKKDIDNTYITVFQQVNTICFNIRFTVSQTVIESFFCDEN